MAALTFNSLPAEIRNRIYAICTPLTSRIEDFRGLLLVSKQIRDEYEGEAIKVMQQHFKSIEKSWPHAAKVYIDLPTRFLDLANVTVKLPISLYFLTTDLFVEMGLEEVHQFQIINTRMESSLAPLFSLWLSKLTFTYYIDQPSVRHELRAIPLGFLYDITNVLVNQPASDFHGHTNERRTGREFSLDRPLHVCRIAYKWPKDGSSSSFYNYHIDRSYTQFFLTEEWWWQSSNANSLVSNWGSGNDWVCFDLDI